MVATGLMPDFFLGGLLGGLLVLGSGTAAATSVGSSKLSGGTSNYFQSLVFFCCAGIPHCAISLIRRQNGKMGGGHGIKLSDSLRDALLGPSIVKRFWQKSGGGQKKAESTPRSV